MQEEIEPQQKNGREAKKLSAQDLYSEFEKAYSSFQPGEWKLAIFEGSPEGELYSWCPDCVVASSHIRRFEELGAPLRLLKFKVGSKEEWEGHVTANPFKEKYPRLSDVPTAILFLGRLDVARMIAPREDDLEYLTGRAEIYKRQIESEEWHVPKRFKGPRLEAGVAFNG